jgi:thymidine kinase
MLNSITQIILFEKLCMRNELLGRIDKGVKCSVSGCGREAARSLSTEKVKSAGLNVGSGEKRAYLCREHYKEFKKKTKKDKTIEKWRYSA